jgi:hypothetical protein
MTQRLRAHFDGRVIVPDEPVELPVGRPLEVSLRPLSVTESAAGSIVQERLRKLRQFAGCLSGPVIPLEALRRENLYGERT